ncbi:MAG: YdcF family protein [Nitrospirae bacterium]|nr:YdcF family protein [Nitrospirota bacterium]
MYDLIKLLIDPLSIVLTIIIVLTIFINREKSIKHKRFILYALLGIFIMLYTLSTTFGTNLLFYPLERDYLTLDIYDIHPPEIVVVLAGGCYLNKTRDKLFVAFETPSRLIHGLQIYNKYNAKLIVFSGGYSEGKTMAETAVRLGIDRSKILVEGKSLNTFQHAKELNLLLEDKSPAIGIVTCAYHMKRSVREFNKYFKNVIPIPSEFIYNELYFYNIEGYIPTSYNLNKSSIAIKELIGNLWYIIRY